MRRTVMTMVPLFAVLALACDTGRKGSAGFHIPDGDPAKGKQVFLEHRCNSCHEVAGVAFDRPVADPPVQVRLGGKVYSPPTDGVLATAILHPSYRVAGPREVVMSGRLSRMGDFTDAMTLREMIDVVAFLQSTYEEVPPPVAYR
jgi:mono/diheme cytochrome c family protein